MKKRRNNPIYPWILGAALALAVAVAPVAQAATGQTRDRPMLQDLGLPQRVLDPPEFYLMPRPQRPFLEERAALMETVLRAGDVVPRRARALIDLAEFHFAHGMMSEGLSLLSEVQGRAVPLAYRLRAEALELALGLLDPLGRPLSARAQRLLEPQHARWPDQVLLLTLSRLNAGACGAAGSGLRGAFDRLQRFPAPVRERVLPALLDCAIDGQQWRLARDIAGRFEDHAGLRDGAALHFLLGKVAETGDAPMAAFDSYAQAQGDTGLWGHRARRALVDLGLRHEALTAAEAVELLALEAELWRGDALAADTLVDLADLRVIAGDPVAAIETYGRLMVRHARTPVAEQAAAKAIALTREMYAKGAEGTLSMSGFMALHARAAPWLRFTPGFAEAAERFADTFHAAGATVMAAQEFATIRNYLMAGQDLGLFDADTGQIDRLAVKEAEALLHGGQFEVLGALLAAPPTPKDPEMAQRLALVSARYLDETGQRAALVSADGAGAPEQVLRLRAQARFEREEWAEAQAAYALLAQRAGADLPLPDAIRYLLAAHRSGDAEAARALAVRFETLADVPEWAEVVGSLTAPPADLLPLREGTARQRIDNAQEMLDTLSGPNAVN
ncbi:hypothetical protein [Marinovum sp. KMM 9879]